MVFLILFLSFSLKNDAFLIVLYRWFTVNYCIIYENMRNENEKSFLVRRVNVFFI